MIALVVLPVRPAHAAFDLIQRPWCQFRTTHVDLISDLSADRAHQLLTRLEQFDRAAGLLIDQPADKLRPRLKVLLFAHRRDFEQVFDSPGFVGFMSASIHDNLLTVGPDAAGEYLVENLLHEYVHHLLRNDPAGAWPLWYEEGLASFLATLRFERTAAGEGEVVKVILGAMTKHQPERLHRRGHWREVRVRYLDAPTALRQNDPVWLRQLLTAGSVGDRDNAAEIQDFYQRSWLLVHLLLLGSQAGFADRSERLRDYLEAVRHGADPVAAFTQRMNDGLAEVARDVERYRERHLFPERTLTLAAAPLPAVEARGCLDPAQAAYELGMASTSINPAFARDAFDWLIERSSDDPRAYIGYSVIERGAGAFEEAFRTARYALRLDRHNVRARVELATVMVEACREDQDPRCRRQWRNAAALYAGILDDEPDRIDAAFGLGVAQLLLGEPALAIGALQRAHAQAPWAPRISLFLGEAHRLAGNSAQAGWHLARAARWEVEPAWRDKAKQAIRLLETSRG